MSPAGRQCFDEKWTGFVFRVFVIQERQLLRAAMCSLLSQEKDLSVVGAAGTDPRALPDLATPNPDVVVLDIDTEGEADHGIVLAQKLNRHRPRGAVLMLTGRSTPAYLQLAISAGSRGLVAKDTSAGALVDAVRRLGRGETFIEPRLAQLAAQAARSPLTQRELDVLRLAADGSPVSEIAGRLILSTGTVRNYLSSAICKTQARNRIDAIRVARQAGWL